MCEIVVLEYSAMLQYISDQSKTQEMREKTINDYPFLLKSVYLHCYMFQISVRAKICVKLLF